MNENCSTNQRITAKRRNAQHVFLGESDLTTPCVGLRACSSGGWSPSDTCVLCDAPPAKDANRGRMAGCKDAAFRLSPGDTPYGKGVAQSSLADGDEIRVIRDGPRLSFAVNGIWLGEAFTTLPESGHLYLCTELKGRAAQVDIVGQGPW